MRKLLPVLPLLVLVFLLVKCAGVPGQGGGQASPVEVQIATVAIVGLTLARTEWQEADLVKIQAYLLTVQKVLILAIDEDITSLDITALSFIDGVEPEFAIVLDSITKLALLRIQPYLQPDTLNKTLAKEYIEAVLTGAIQAVESKLRRLDN